MERYDWRKELAPRDIVARAIVSEMKRRGVPCVYLDVTHLPAQKLKAHFPTIYERCLNVGMDITRTPIPIVPAQHYQCGGIVTDLEGATELPRLYAAGEVACTGVHGANRLASNSLLEAMVFAYRAAQHTLALASIPLPAESQETAFRAKMERDPELLGARLETGLPEDLNRPERMRAFVQQTLQQNAGIVRTTEELENARAVLQVCQNIPLDAEETDPAYQETRNITLLGLLIVESALRRRESRGLHYTLDFPHPIESERHDTLLIPERKASHDQQNPGAV
jgi:L-aspartate oxidase